MEVLLAMRFYYACAWEDLSLLRCHTHLNKIEVTVHTLILEVLRPWLGGAYNKDRGGTLYTRSKIVSFVQQKLR